MDEMDAIRATFFQECEELLVELESGLLVFQRGRADAETINSVFRAVHSIKGGAGVFGLEAMVRFSHVFETVLEAVRADRLGVTPELTTLLLSAHDELINHVNAARAGRADERRASPVAQRLGQIVDNLKAPEEDPFGFTPIPAEILPLDNQAAPGPEAEATPAGWSIQFRPLAELYRKANEPAVLLRELARLGEMRATLDLSDLPSLAQLDPEDSYLAWTLAVAGDVAQEQVLEVFEFVEGDCDLIIEPLTQLPDAPEPSAPKAAPQETAPEPAATSPMEEPGAEPESAADDYLFAPQQGAEPPRAQPLVLEAPATSDIAPPAPAAIAAPLQGAEERPQPQQVIRVDPEKIDRLIDLVGELVISQVMLAQKVEDAGLSSSSDLAAGLEDLEQLTREIQDGVMAVRAQPVRTVFQRMPRLVREVAAVTGKQVRLVTEGDATELDRSVIERLADPLTHLIRNAIDHGLESPADRRALGKPPEGLLTLTAKHRGARILIELSDDGRGIDRPRVLRTAVAKGLVAPDAALDDDAIDALIFTPGFSTASEVSDISGRGVGMDVVRGSVQALGGRINVASTPGQGVTFTLSLPLTLAVLDGMQVQVCGQTLIAPLAAIIESIQPRREDVRQIGSGHVLAVRDRFIPLIDIGTVLGFRTAPIHPSDGIVLLVETDDGGRIALVADDIHGQRQVVIKSLESNYGHVAGISAATIMGDGRVALIIDIDAVISMRQRPTPAPLLAAE